MQELVSLIFALLVVDARGHEHGHGSHHDHQKTKNSTNSTATTATSMTEAYLYGTLSVAIVSALSLAGVIALPFIKRKTAYNAVMLTFMSLAVGTMTSDAILHLIPESLGLHVHDHDHSGNDKPYLGKLVVLLATLYGLYLIEIMALGVSKILKKPSAVHDASAGKGATVKSPNKESINIEMTSPNNPNPAEMWSTRSNVSHGHSHGSDSDDTPQYNTICGLPSVAFVITVSDALHNLTDGLAIGTAFAKSSAAGLAVSIAVVCHELPHEVGDFAILLNTGMSVKKALILNFISALTCFAGVYPGIVAGQQELLRQWIFAVVAGGFLYVALVHMLREIKDFTSLPRYLSVTLQNVGLLLGFIVVLVLAVYEDELSGAV